MLIRNFHNFEQKLNIDKKISKDNTDDIEPFF